MTTATPTTARFTTAPTSASSPDPTSTDAAVLPWLRLAHVRGLGSRERTFLRTLFERPSLLFELEPDVLAQEIRHRIEDDPHGDDIALPKDIVARLQGRPVLAEARAELARARAHGLALHTPASPDYPDLLAHVDDPPLVLFSKGTLPRVGEHTVSIVGSRRAKDFECKFAHELATDLAAHGVLVASGLAKGIDKAAHEGALAVPGGRTVAVLGCGLARVYPAEHGDLAAEILERGALLSELPVDAPPRKHHFPQRNRIVSGIAAATVVLSAGERSGALITAARALEQGREVFTIPGRLDDELARGTNGLLKEGAKLIEGANDVLEELKWKEKAPDGSSRPPLVRRPTRPKLPGELGAIEALLESGRGRTFDELAQLGRLAPTRLLATLGRLQAMGRVRGRGSLYELTS